MATETPSPVPEPAPDLLTTREAAVILRVSVATMEGWRMEERGPPFYRLAGARGSRCAIRYDRAELLRWIESQRVNTVPLHGARDEEGA